MAAAVWLTATILPGVKVKTFGTAIGVAAVFGVLNWALGWLLWTVFTIGTLGIALLLAFITRWIIDAIFLKLTDGVLDGFKVDSFGVAVLASLMIAGFSTLAQWLIG
jgi:putative membrane protein